VSSPDIVVLDTRQARDKASFLEAAARDLGFPDYFGRNWDAFEECLRDFGMQRTPVLVVWTGAAGVPDDVRGTAVEIFNDALPTGADVLIVDDVSTSAAPDFALDHIHIAIPVGAEQSARAYWIDTVGLTEVPRPPAMVAREGLWLSGDALNLHLGTAADFIAANKAHPGILVADYEGLLQRLESAGYRVTDAAVTPGTRRCHTNDPFGNRIEFIAF
jgi:RNAse (barnase) inhibitor barstar